jgi:hypothetical protein
MCVIEAVLPSGSAHRVALLLILQAFGDNNRLDLCALLQVLLEYIHIKMSISSLFRTHRTLYTDSGHKSTSK